MKKVMLFALCGVLSFSTLAASKEADVAKQADTICGLTWEQITDVIINKQTPEATVDKAIAKIKSLTPSLDEASANQMKGQLLSSLKASTSDEKFAHAVKNDTKGTHKQFMDGCVAATSQALAGIKQ